MLSFEYAITENADNNDDEFRVLLIIKETVQVKHWTGKKMIEQANIVKIAPLSDWMEYEPAMKLMNTLQTLAESY